MQWSDGFLPFVVSLILRWPLHVEETKAIRRRIDAAPTITFFFTFSFWYLQHFSLSHYNSSPWILIFWNTPTIPWFSHANHYHIISPHVHLSHSSLCFRLLRSKYKKLIYQNLVSAPFCISLNISMIWNLCNIEGLKIHAFSSCFTFTFQLRK